MIMFRLGSTSKINWIFVFDDTYNMVKMDVTKFGSSTGQFYSNTDIKYVLNTGREIHKLKGFKETNADGIDEEHLMAIESDANDLHTVCRYKVDPINEVITLLDSTEIGYDEVSSIDWDEKYLVVGMPEANDGKGKMIILDNQDLSLFHEIEGTSSIKSIGQKVNIFPWTI